MKFEALVKQTSVLEAFDLSLLVQAFDESREGIRVQLVRWMKAGRVIGLRRGMYALPDTYRHAPLAPARLANLLYRPSSCGIFRNDRLWRPVWLFFSGHWIRPKVRDIVARPTGARWFGRVWPR